MFDNPADKINRTFLFFTQNFVCLLYEVLMSRGRKENASQSLILIEEVFFQDPSDLEVYAAWWWCIVQKLIPVSENSQSFGRFVRC